MSPPPPSASPPCPWLRSPRDSRSWWSRCTISVPPPVLLPLALHPAAVGGVLEAVAPGLGWLLAPGPRAALLVLTLGSAAVAIAVMLREGDRRAAAETAGLVAVFCVVAPLLAFGVYFGFWHGARHIARLMAMDPRNHANLVAGTLARPLRRYARSAALPTLASLGVLGTLWWGAAGTASFVAAHLGLLAALTMPHVAVVAWLDRVRPDAVADHRGAR